MKRVLAQASLARYAISTGPESQMSLLIHVVTQAWAERYLGNEKVQGFECSSLIVRKIRHPNVSWEVRASDILASAYPRE